MLYPAGRQRSLTPVVWRLKTPSPLWTGWTWTASWLGTRPLNRSLVTSPAEVGHGLGPVFNQTSCVGCHARDGRGREGFGDVSPFIGSMLMRVSLPGTNPEVPGGPQPVPGFGEQIGRSRRFRGRTRSADRRHLL